MQTRLKSQTLLSLIAVALGLLCGSTRAQESPGDAAHTARSILEATGVKGGLVVHLGCGDGRLTAALADGPQWLVQGLDADPDHVEQARQHVRSLGRYGQVAIDYWTGTQLPYVDNLVNLVVADRPVPVSMDEVRRVLAPQGVAYLHQDGKWVKTIKPRPNNIDEWTHALHGPDNNAVSNDEVVGPPHHFQWIADPEWSRSHDHLASLSALVASGGRVFSIVDEGPTSFVVAPSRWRLVARDAFNGVLLWKRPITPWEGHLRGFRSGPADLSRRLVAIDDRVYVTPGYGKPVEALDGATGETILIYPGTIGTQEIVHDGGVLFLVAGDRAAEEASAAAWRRGVTPPPHNKRILAIEAETGDVLWRKSDADTAEVMPTTLAVKGDRVFFQSPNHIICLDRDSSDELWRAERRVARKRLGWSTPTLVVYEDVVLSADRDVSTAARGSDRTTRTVEWIPSSAGGQAPPGELIAFSIENGERRWSTTCREGYNSPVDVLVADGLLWTGDLVKHSDPGITQAIDPGTGEVERTRSPDQEQFTVGMTHARCYRHKATNRYLILGRAGVEFIDLDTGEAVADHWLRGTCQYGVMPCNGLLYVPPHSCACYVEAKVNAFNAMAPKREARINPQAAGERLQRGPAYGDKRTGTEVAASDWPTYRHDAGRSGHTDAAIPVQLKSVWQTKLGSRLSSPTVAAGRVFVADIDAHTVHALDGETGEKVWSYTAGGRVDSPPTVHKQSVVFGSADGWVCCLRVSDGALRWRFRAAPADRRIVAFGQLASAWPVHGSILVHDGAAYFAAGRCSFVDGGIHVYRLDVKTGEVLARASLDGRDPDSGAEPQEIIDRVAMTGALPDVLSSDGQSIYMRHKRFDCDLAEQSPDVPHLYSPAGFLDDAWWHRTYWIHGTTMNSGYGGWPRIGNEVPAGRLLTVNDPVIYGFGRDHYAHTGSHVGLDSATVFHYKPDRDAKTRWTEYRLFAMSRETSEETSSPPPRKPGARQAKARQPAKKTLWSVDLPILVRAMVSTDDRLFVAGPAELEQESTDKGDWLRGRPGFLQVVSTSDGQTLAEYKLDAPPVFDGMAADDGGLYLSTLDGEVVRYVER